MSTNFYWAGQDRDAAHIGKRSAAGLYCYSCNRSLYSLGEEHVHSGKGRMLDKCPTCGRPKSSKEIDSACSFTWAQEPEGVLLRCLQRPFEPLVTNDHDAVIRGSEFMEMLYSICPIRFYHLIGKEFS